MGSLLVDACMRRSVERTPVWFMRQAGRYLPSYQKVRAKKGILEIAADPALASDVTVDPVKELGVDAAVVFADIMLPLQGIGVKFRIEENVGPVIDNPIRSMEGVESLGTFSEEQVSHVLETVRLAVEKLGGVPLVGFSGAPFTLASYLIEGSPTRDFRLTKRVMYSQPETWRSLMELLSGLVVDYLIAQVKSGASAVQLFDSWVGCLSPLDYEAFVKPYTARIVGAVKGGAPVIHFCADSSALIESFADLSCDVLSVDWRVPIDSVWGRTGGRAAVQGNLDPAAAVAGGKILDDRVMDILRRAKGKPGHIFNLGHGVMRDTPPENLKKVVKLVAGESSK